MSPLSNLPGEWCWERRGDTWWRVNDKHQIEDGPHRCPLRRSGDHPTRVTLPALDIDELTELAEAVDHRHGQFVRLRQLSTKEATQEMLTERLAVLSRLTSVLIDAQAEISG